ncbi:hypothetical protein BKA70DRAFT_1563759 [Coprinopsis sp. MPI-PUGE-AT-0042]|nr:hypothetical protein BKA70DRAFT_1563759 [Coprinopsis sp. MPI-PUGE-AT-0042]
MADIPDERAHHSGGQETEPGATEDVDRHCSAVIENLRLNYAFFDPSEGIPPPLPLSIPRALLDAPTADLRSILREKLEAEEVILKLREIRFWRAKQPLQVAHALDDRNVWIQKEGAERKFEAIPFTESLSSSLGEWIWDEKLLHLIVTGSETPFILEPATPDSSTSTMTPASQTVAIGTYFLGYTTPERKSWKDVREGERHCQDISIIPNPSPDSQSPGRLPNFATQIPTILLGISRMSVTSHADDIQVLSYVSNVDPDGFRLHFDTFGRTLLYNGRLNWMAISPHHRCLPLTAEVIQCGVADSQSTQPRKLGRRYTKQRVSFRKAYGRTPNVFSCLAGLNVGGSGSTHWDIRTFATNIDREGFTLNIEKTRDSEQDVNKVVANAQISWMAFPSGGIAGQKMACGEFHLSEGEMRLEEDQHRHVRWRGQLSFTETFTSAPKVFVALTSFDVDRSTHIRLLLAIENITREGMEWKVTSWDGTIVYSATFAYLAVEGS